MIRRLIAKITVVCFAFSALALFVVRQDVDMSVMNKIVGTTKEYVQSEEGQQTCKAIGQIASATVTELKEILSVNVELTDSDTEQADISAE